MSKRKTISGSETEAEDIMPSKQRMRQAQLTKETAVTQAATLSVSDFAAFESKGSEDHSVVNTEFGHQIVNPAAGNFVNPSSSQDKEMPQLDKDVDYDSDSDIEEYSSMEQPPLIKQLKTILAEYPDDGQIIKELLQNAEDAGASEVKILYDDRRINTQKENMKETFRKFLRGPALCLFNDAKFTEKDWLGIKMIYSSVKEKDPLKVGRFGLGFKSVFHITDNLVVLSGDRILFMDPHRSSDRVCVTIKLSKLKKYKKLKMEDILMTLDGTFGVSKDILETGRYNGTLFWFPLRFEASKLSATVYNREKVMDLFTSFRNEASSMLVFLKHLTKVSLHERMSESNMIHLHFTLELVENIDEVRESRKNFLTKIINLDRSVSESSIYCIYRLSFCTKSFDGNNSAHEATADWMVTNYYKGGTLSDELRALIEDYSLGYIPLVGVAAPVGENCHEFKSHAYCFLPLPQKTKSMTGLPVHVNGFFALSQNRQYIKWPSAEQAMLHLHKEKSLLWNEKLLTEVLPDAYETLITEMINHATRNGNPHDLIQSIYATIPRVDNVTDEWYALLPSFFKRIISIPTLMAVNRSGEKNWISCLEAFFATFHQYTDLRQCIKSTLVKVLQMYDKRYVDVPFHVFEAFSKFNNTLRDTSPQSFAAVLKENSRYKSLSREDKLFVLEFLTLDYKVLEGLELLPLEDGSFVKFVSRQNTSDQILLCSKNEIELFPGLERKFVSQEDPIQWLEKHMTSMAKQGLYQIKFMDSATFLALLEGTIQEHLSLTSPPIATQSSILTSRWIEKVWEHIFSNEYDVGLFQHIPMIPLLKKVSWSDMQEIELYRLTDFLIVKEMPNMPSFHDGVYRCLELLSIKVLPSLPLWLQTSRVLQYIHYSTVNGVIELLGKVNCSPEREGIIDAFNSSCIEEDKKEFVSCLAGCKSWNSESRNLVRYLKLFIDSHSLCRTVLIQENTTVINTKEYPVKFPRSFIIGDREECLLACALGAKEIDRNTLILETLTMMQGVSYTATEKLTFMQYFLKHIGEFEQDRNMVNMASRVAFLESNITLSICTPAALFDPLDSRLLELFVGEDRFPAKNCFQSNTDIVSLRKLHLKMYPDVSAVELYETALVIEKWCNSETEKHLVLEKSKRFLEVLKENITLLSNDIHGFTLKEKLMDTRCMLHAVTKCQNFPRMLPWFQPQYMLSKPSELRNIMFSRLVGSTMPLIDCHSKELAEVFGWNQNPPQDKVLEQLTLLINVYESSYKPELLPIIQEIYYELNTYKLHDLLGDPNFVALLNKGCIWRGDGFSSPKDIFLESKGNDLNLAPYLYKLPEEFERLNSLFLRLGCNKEQNIDVLLKTQLLIREKYQSGEYSEDDVRRDLSIVVSILNRLRQAKNEIQDRLHEIMFPIHCSNASDFAMKPGPECTYCNAQWLRDMTEEDKDEDEIYYVHEDVSNMTAEELGVKSLTQQLLSDTEELVMEEYGQEEELTTRLNRLLKEGYQDGFSVVKEIVQNADDAGAKCVYFLYDERENEDAKINLWDEGMAECQGRAIWAYNDAQFEANDFKNITRLNAATKKDELEKIGKFGLGFCSVYNLTDVPSFISGSNIVVFDPHKSHLGKALPGSSPGMKIDFGKIKNLKMMKRVKNQFKPYENVFGCKIAREFKGTLFRFPLRTALQAEKSKICDKYYSKKECMELLHMTIEAAGNLLLFTQHIREIKILHLPADCENPEEAKVIYFMTKEQFQGQTQDSYEEHILSEVSKLKSAGELGFRPLERLSKITIMERIEHCAGLVLPALANVAGMSAKVSWLISWATGTNETLTKTFQDVVGALPLSAVAVPFEMRENLLYPVQLKDLPFGFYKRGHWFCFLPLPIACDLPVHINGCFALKSDRRSLMCSTEDDKAQQSSWNSTLIQDALVNAYIYLLESIREIGPRPEYEYYSLWPLDCQEILLPIREHFLKKLVQLKLRLFHRDLLWQSFDKCVFLDSTFRNEKAIGELAFETLLTFHSRENSVVMELPDHVMKSLETYNQYELRNRIVSREQFFLSVFLPNIESRFWSQSLTNIYKRDKLVMYALELEYDKVKEALYDTRCIPSEPNGALKRPKELVNPLGILSDMFSDDDEVFPQGKKTFRQRKITEHLINLGMLDKDMPFKFLEDRCHSVKKRVQTCGECAVERCSMILKYLSGNSVISELEKNEENLQKLRNITFLPVLQKPYGWQFSWKGNTKENSIVISCQKNHPPKIVMLDSPVNMFLQCTRKLVGCVELILDEASITSSESNARPLDFNKLLKMKGSRKNDVPYDAVIRQLKTIAQEYKLKKSEDTYSNCKAIVDDIYSFLDRQCKRSNEITKACFQGLSKDEVILVGKKMIDASRVAFHLEQNCSPVLFSIQNTDMIGYMYLSRAIGIRDHFDLDCIVKVLGDERRQWGLNPLSEEGISLIHGLLSALRDSMEYAGRQYGELNEYQIRNIVAPDTDNILRETSSLCLDDSEFETGPDTKTIHGKFSPELALSLGVKTKRGKCFDELSFLIAGGQKEKLVTRLRGILSAYPCDDGIMRELLQNADDAQATEIHFIKDYRTHACEKIFDEKYAPLQGPALCVFNNSSFTQSDIEGIHELGLGSKREDPLKTGQYGVGFNAVYQLTDAPSFLTKGTELEHGEMLCIFDPTCQYLPKVSEQNPGVRCLVGPIRKNYPDILKGYLEEELFKSNVGTMFRLPFQNEKSFKKAHISSEQVDDKRVNTILKTFCDDSFVALLFLKHVSKIIVSDISSGEITEEYRVETHLSDSDRRQRDEFFKVVKQISDQYKQDRTCIRNMFSKEVGYIMTISDSRGEFRSYYVVQRIGFENELILPETVVCALKDNNLGQLPIGGVAIVIPNKQMLIDKLLEHQDYGTVRGNIKWGFQLNEESGRAFCFLPLPIKTGLPCHINGHFVLDHEARRSLWKELQGYRHDWNHCIFQYIVAPAYISALLFLKKHLFEDLSTKSLYVINRLLDVFVSYFPLTNKATENDWKSIAVYVYRTLNSMEVHLFPVVQEKDILRAHNTHSEEAHLEWTALQMPRHAFAAYFHHQRRPVSKILKSVGMKIIEIPEIIRKSMEESDLKPKMLNPSSALKFLKSHSSSGLGICNLKVNVPLTETTFVKLDNVYPIMEYIAGVEHLETEIDNTPILVTNDDVLRTFSTSRPVFSSSFSDLFPFSLDQFVHAELVSSQLEQIWRSGVLLKMGVHNLLDLLPATLPIQVFRVGQDVPCQRLAHEIPNQTWILRFWQFIYVLSVKSTLFGTETIDHKAVKRNMEMLNQWSLFPVQCNDEKFILRPINDAYTVIDILSFDRRSALRSALEKLNLPKLDTVIFSESKHTDVLRMVLSLVSSQAEPMKVLNCLYYHRNSIRNSQLTSGECKAILVFLSQHIPKLREQKEDTWIRGRIRALPLHITQQDTSTSLDGNENVFVLPIDMPVVGLSELATNAGYIFIRQDRDLQELHSLLQCTFANTTIIYCSIILPRFDELPKCYHLEHLWYINKTLLCDYFDGNNFDENQKEVIKVLKLTPFIPSGDRMSLASEFYDPYHKVFACMCDSSNFPPSPFNDQLWNRFMKLAGLKTKVSASMFLEFAESLALEGAHHVSENICHKSRILVEFLWTLSPCSWESGTIERLARVKFIAPHQASDKNVTLCKQYSESKNLICFSQSTPSRFELLCWTSVNLLPEWTCPGSNLKQMLPKLGVHSTPPVERVVLQCQNICDALKKKFSSKDHQHFDINWFTDLLDQIYVYLSEHRDEDPRMKAKLANTPVVFLPKNRLLVHAKHIVVDLSNEEMIEPYLYKAPDFYGRYNDFFIFLGSAQQVSLNHYCLVLRLVYQQLCDHDKKLLPPEMRTVGNAVRNIVTLLERNPDKETDLDEKILYLPDRSQRLLDARCLIVSDNEYLESRLHECKMDYFIGFKLLDVKVSDPRPVIKALPECCRPKLLSELAKEEIDTTEMNTIESAEAERLERFLHSNEFIQGILRLVKHEKTESDETFTSRDEANIIDQIQGLKIKEVKGLYTYLQINRGRIESSKSSKMCFINEEMNGNSLRFTLYFQVEDGREEEIQKDLIANPNCIIGLIKRCTNNTIQRKTDILYAILNCLPDNYRINNTLDMLDIDPYDTQQNFACSVFPRPGTYVPQEFHAFLEQGFSQFQKHEYDSVAYELEDDEHGSDSYDDSVYIYVHILRPLESMDPRGTGIKDRYLIDIGDHGKGQIIVYAYELFKFERKVTSSSQDLIPSDCLSVGSQPFDYICCQIRDILQEAWTLSKIERRRVLKRLLLRWHPDKNIGQQDYCNKIFNFIQEFVSQLDIGQSPDHTNRNYSNCMRRNIFTGTEYENLGRRINSRSNRYRDYYIKHEGFYYTAHSRAYYSGRCSYPAIPVPDQPSAVRWLRQAKKDLSSAKGFLPTASDVPAFNWICYLSHQAIEKALKAAVYATDANKVNQRSHQLSNIARNGGLSQELLQWASKVEESLGAYTRMRYPGSIDRTQIPAEIYTDEQARTTLERAEKVIQLVNDNYIN